MNRQFAQDLTDLWDEYLKARPIPTLPTSFAHFMLWVLEELDKKSNQPK